MTAPKLFISYSWTSTEHEDWVLKLAHDLAESGVEVKFDKWDLKEGQDPYHFMEQMVADETITKVIMICDKKYKRVELMIGKRELALKHRLFLQKFIMRLSKRNL